MSEPCIVGTPYGTGRTSRRWLATHAVDLLVLPLGAAVTLRFWCIFFGIRQRSFIVCLALAALCELLRRCMAARRAWHRPHLFGPERRFDLTTALLLATGPWPIALPLDTNPIVGAAWQSLTPSDGITAVIGLSVVGVALWRLAAEWGEMMDIPDVLAGYFSTLRRLE